MTPSSQINPRQTWPVTLGKNAEQLQSSLRGSMAGVSAMPTIIPRLFSPGHCTLLLGPPSVPRSSIDPLRQRVACRVPSPGRLEKPATQSRLLMPLPRLTVPPSVEESLTTSYRVREVSLKDAWLGWVTSVSLPQPHTARPAIRTA